ncbi:MAG: dihydroorotate dehydrogenase-like protein [Candidatus Brocadiae bacterium]|nr:dihydroorotate dehydrogenase-like protein [Candidatus Brocadiia bacterium]
MTPDLSTTWLGLKLSNPLMPGASPLVDDLDAVRKLEDAGASAIVMHSLFEEQIIRESTAQDSILDAYTESYTEAQSYFPDRGMFPFGPEGYVRHVERLRETVRVPLIASLNGTSRGGWIDFARAIERAGASALELNLYDLGADPRESALDAESRLIDLVRAVKDSIRIPLAVKIGPYFSSLAHFARELERAGADGIVMFNRFYQPDIDTELLEIAPALRLSDPSELRLRLRWLAILRGQIKGGLAASGGVHSHLDAVKAVMAGADAVQMVSALLTLGPDHLGTVLGNLRQWMIDHDYTSIAQMKGSMSLERCPDPKAVERSNYAFVLQTWRQERAQGR